MWECFFLLANRRNVSETLYYELLFRRHIRCTGRCCVQQAYGADPLLTAVRAVRWETEISPNNYQFDADVLTRRPRGQTHDARKYHSRHFAPFGRRGCQIWARFPAQSGNPVDVHALLDVHAGHALAATAREQQVKERSRTNKLRRGAGQTS